MKMYTVLSGWTINGKSPLSGKMKVIGSFSSRRDALVTYYHQVYLMRLDAKSFDLGEESVTTTTDGGMETCLYKQGDYGNNSMTISLVVTDNEVASDKLLVSYIKSYNGSLDDKVNSLVNEMGFDRETAVYLVNKTL